MEHHFTILILALNEEHFHVPYLSFVLLVE